MQEVFSIVCEAHLHFPKCNDQHFVLACKTFWDNLVLRSDAIYGGTESSKDLDQREVSCFQPTIHAMRRQPRHSDVRPVCVLSGMQRKF